MSQASQTLKLGTRRSLLAWAQSSWVAREVERLNPGTKVELVGIDTRGDKILDVSLQSIEGKEFFVAELDEALAEGRVDFNVHSLKDLSLERSSKFICAAIPKRENSRDVILYGPGVLEKIRAGKTLRIGTSSPRRQENIPPFLNRVLPRVGGESPWAELVEIRGNVNTRLSRVHEPEGSAKQLDGVVLAFAGLIRLWNDEAGRKELSQLLQGVRWMVLPLKECPSAPGQGALAVECRRDDSRTRQVLSSLHHPETATHVERERGLLAEFGGGCHQRFGASATSMPSLGELFYVRGVRPDGEFIESFGWEKPARGSGASWNGMLAKAPTSAIPVPQGLGVAGRAVFLAHSRALPAGLDLSTARVWTSGTSSWQKLAAQGIWIEGSAENLGYESLVATLCEPVLQLPVARDWLVLTHESAQDGWSTEGSDTHEVIATYRISGEYSGEAVESLKNADLIYWSSSWQFDRLRQHAKPGARHGCGPGKTFEHLKANGIEAQIFPSAEEWKRWLES